MRYLTEDKEFEVFDERRLVDSRFFLFMGVVSNCLFQIQSMLSPLPDTNQFQVNIYYWIFTILTIVCLVLSYTKMRWIVLGLAIHATRNIVPMFDPEDRRKVMTNAQWHMLTMF